MRYRASIQRLAGGDWYARCAAAPGGPAAVQAASRDGALEGLRSEIRFRLELCPCSAVADDYVVLDIAEEAISTPRGSRRFDDR